MFYNYDNNQRPLGAQQYHYLRLIWSEQDINLEYTLRFNTTRRGFWISSAPQKGSICMNFIKDFSFFFFILKMVFMWSVHTCRYHAKIELWSVHRCHTSDESREQSNGINFLWKSARQTIFYRCSITATKHFFGWGKTI